jgi:hypothetical protein
MRRSFLFLLTLLALGASPTARADDGPTCSEAFDQSQVKRDEGKLLEARKLLRACSGATCSPTQQRLCLEWLTDVNVRMPAIVLSAKDGSGADLVDVKVTMDGVQVATKLDGRAIDVDPGAHSFTFELADGTRAETRTVAEESGKGKVVSVTLGRPPAPAVVPPPPPLPLPVVSPPSAPVAPAPAASEDASSGGGTSPVRTTGFILGAAGIAGLALGTVFGLEALSTKSSHCDSTGRCDPGTATTADNQATASTIGFIAGGVLFAGGLTMVLLAPKSGQPRPATSLAVAPMVGLTGGGLQLAGRW